ncbi:hypothetical protein H2201_002351 [Coniosporium apollinis]|uniref:HORMA domain-containing protein n=1 Tax=Coniosporium apollinis TaxID=61459 RepID=A0ABQ9NZB7_9PEZI|nr:hypothetical protein H2201_002351 [Coniosporium apollinis]
MSTTTTLPATYTTLLSTFADFLTISIHTILYVRSLYPRTTFLTARAYNHAVHQSRHPALCAWITDAISAVSAAMLAGGVERVVLVVYDTHQRPLERVVWDVSRFPVVGREDRDTPIVRPGSSGGRGGGNNGGGGTGTGGLNIVDMEEQFRAAMARLSVCGEKLKPLPEGCSFTLAVELGDGAEAPLGHPQVWIPIEPGLQRGDGERGGQGGEKSDAADTRKRRERGEDLGGLKTMPVRAVDAGEMVFEMWIEEGKAKFEGSENSSSASSG